MVSLENRLTLESLSPLHWVGIGLAAVTAGVHLVLGVGFLPHWMGLAFLVATAGFVLGIVLVLVDYRRRLLYLLGIPFTAGQVILWYAVNRPEALDAVSPVEIVDKLAQLLLIVVLLALSRRD
ncbi:DUF7475 family protein [Natrarchaeobius chitinivorans]|uniref:Uncharacterized protein n=1 Tax=Natrarchaeobius chitinivorans TaxID=1679083 RepID=A0A3N6MGP7_NATCH|nr:hypothetical protein [Natrarchaeobius chitinivorans]RQG96000.1 hypothetical protein EA473_07430 [Natrarchaeobius chitinivorans]